MATDAYKSRRPGLQRNASPKCKCGARRATRTDGLCDNCRHFQARVEAREARGKGGK